MRFTTGVRVSGAWWLWAVVVAIAYLFVSGSVPAESAYPLAAQVVAYQGLFLIAPLVSLTAAAAAAKFRPAGLDRRPRARSHLAVRFDRLWPIVFSSLFGLTVAMLLAGREFGALAPMNGRLVIVSFFELTLFVVFGDLAGSRLPLKAAGPVAVVVPYLLVAFPPSMTPLWLRHLFGINSTCCFVWDTVAWSVVAASCLTAVAGVVMLLAIGARPSAVASTNLRRAITVVAVAGVLIAVAVSAVDQRDWSAGQPRAGGPACSNSQPQICTWPEHSEAKKELVALAAKTATKSKEFGVPLPERISEQNSADVRWPTTATDFHTQYGVESLNRQFFSALAPSMTTECTRQLGPQAGEQLLPYMVGQYMVSTWWMATMTGEANLDSMQAPVPEAATAMADLLRRPVREQAKVIRQAVDSMATCQLLQPQRS